MDTNLEFQEFSYAETSTAESTATAYSAPTFSSYSAQDTFQPMDSEFSSSYSGPSYSSEDEEPPLLEELGINFDHIRSKTSAVLHPTRPVSSHLMDDTDLAGPLIFCLLFGAALLFAGKLHFGYVYFIAAFGCLGLYMVLSLMSDKPLRIAQAASVLGYSLLPMVALSAIAILLNLSGWLGTILAIISITWCTYSASRMFTSVLEMHSQQWLVAYPCALLYGVFALLAVF